MTTGKLDVREAAAGLPDEVGEPEMDSEETGSADEEESLDVDTAGAPEEDEE